MADRAVGIDQLAPRQALQRLVQPLVREHAGNVDPMDELQELPRIDLVMDHEAVEGGLVLAEILLLERPGRLRLEAQKLLDIFADAPLNLVEQPAGRRVERVIQVENPALGVRGPHKTIVTSVAETAGTLRTRHPERKSRSDA